jgi:hypothetical protein
MSIDLEVGIDLTILPKTVNVIREVGSIRTTYCTMARSLSSWKHFNEPRTEEMPHHGPVFKSLFVKIEKWSDE